MDDAMVAGIYIHIPFCRAKCAYCDFNSYAGAEHWIPQYQQALLYEIARSLGGRGVAARTVFLGGGTPTLLPAEHLSALLHAVPLDASCDEISIEANPGTVTADELVLLRRSGMNRISLGVQSMDDTELALLGRIHDRETAIASFALARAAGFDNINVDLIFGMPGQALSTWRRTLDDVLRLEPEHIALYALTLEPGVPLSAAIECGTLPVPDDDAMAEMYEWAEDRLSSGGYVHYEISNWSLPGRECTHNLIYWRNEPYLGLGAGAWSFWQGHRWGNVTGIAEYVAACDDAGSTVGESETVSAAQEMADTVILRLRLVEGIRFEAFEARFGHPLLRVYGPQVDRLVMLGLLERDERGIRLTRRGRLLGNEVFEQFLAAD